MTLFDRIMDFLGLAKAQVSNSSPEREVRIQLDSQYRQRAKLKEGLTELIFQRKQQERRLVEIGKRLEELGQELNLCLDRQREDLALSLLSERNRLEQEREQVEGNRQFLISEIAKVQLMDQEIRKALQKAETQLSVYISRHQALQLRESLARQIENWQERGGRSQVGLSRLEGHLDRLEARVERLQNESDPEKEIRLLRDEREQFSLRAQLASLKAERERRLLPAGRSSSANC